MQVAPGAARVTGPKLPQSGSNPRLGGGLGSKHGSTTKLNEKLGSMAQLAQAFKVAPATAGGAAAGGGKGRRKDSVAYWQKTLSLRNTSIALEDILHVGMLNRTGKPVLQTATAAVQCVLMICNLGMHIMGVRFVH